MSFPSSSIGDGTTGGGNKKRNIVNITTERKRNSSIAGANFGANNKKTTNTATTAGNSNGGRGAKTTLASLLRYIEGCELIVELKTGKRHRGRLVSADDNMNMMLEETTGENQEGGEKPQRNNPKANAGVKTASTSSSVAAALTTTATASPQTLPKQHRNNHINIRGSNVRYIQFPDNADLPMLISSGRERERNAAKKYQKTKRK